jgi:tetratricopeptide (TPR) repeat protein
VVLSEQPLTPSAGSVAEVRQRLLLWARRPGGGLARVEYSSEFARQQVVQQMQAVLAQDQIAFTPIELLSNRSASEVVQDLLAQLAQVPSGVVSIAGFATAFDAQTPLQDGLRVLNFNREALTVFPLRQIWWMTPALMQVALHAMPDFQGWFSPQLQLNEVVFVEREPMLMPTQGSTVNLEDAYQRTRYLLAQFEVARGEGVADMELLTTYLLPALENLEEVGAQQELRDLTSQFEGLLGSIKRIDVPEMATSMGRLANLYRAQGRYSEAELLFVRSLHIRETQLGAEHLATATSLNDLAGLYYLQGRYGEAESLYVQSLHIYETQLGAEHPDTATSLNNLADLYRSQGRYSEAEPLYVRSIQISETQLGAEHPDTATSLNNLADLYRSQGRYSEAEPLFVQSIQISETQLGAEHPDTATSLNNLAILYQAKGEYSAAELLFVRSLHIRETQLGAEHPDTSQSLNNLAGLYRAQGRYSEAELFYVRSLQIREMQLGAKHPNTAASLNNLAGLYRSQGRYSEAEALYVRSLSILEKALPPDHPNLAIVRGDLEKLREQMGRSNSGEQ